MKLLNICVLFMFYSLYPVLSEDYYTCFYPIVKNNIIYVTGYYGTGGSQPPKGSFIKEFDEITHDSLRYIEFPDYYINNIDVDSKGNKYIFSQALNKNANVDFLETDFIRVIDHKMIVSKISPDNDTVFYNTVIPATSSTFTKMKVTTDDKLVFISSTLPQDQYYQNGNYYFTPDSIYVISDNAIQKKRSVSYQWHLGVDFYIGILSDDGKNIDYGTFWGGIGDDIIGMMDIADNGDIAILGLMYPSDFIGSHEGYPINGKFPCTKGAIQSTLSAYDSLHAGLNTLVDLPISTISVINPIEQKIKYASYYTFGRPRDIKFDKNNKLYLSGWNRKNEIGLPLGSFIAKVDYDNPDNCQFKILSPNDYLDTVFVQTNIEDGNYFITHTRDVFMQIDKNNSFYLVANTMDKTHPVTADAKQKSFSDSLDMIIYKLDKDFSVKYCSYYGSQGYDDIWNFQLGNINNTIYMLAKSQDTSYLENVVTHNTNYGLYITSYSWEELSVNETNSTLSIFPNPATDFINIDEGLIAGEIEIYNSMGILIDKLKAESRINISNYPSGVYTIRSNNRTQRFVKI